MTTPLRAALYLRLSQSDDASTSIDRQERDLREHAEREGWEVVCVLTDDGLSGRKSRANAEEALRMIRDGEIDALAVWKFDRWSRQGLGAVADLIAALDTRPEARFLALRDGLRSEQPAWRIIASVLAEVARMEADNTATRVRSSIATLRHSRRFPGGIAPFGYRPAPAPDGPGRVLVVDPVEAAVLRETATRLLDSPASLVTIALDLTERGIPAPRSAARAAALADRPTKGLDRGVWRYDAVRRIMAGEAILGRVTHHGELVRDTDGLPEQVWEPIVDLSTAQRLRARLLPEARPRRERAARLLSGVVFCAHCGGKMYVKHRSDGTVQYECSASARGVECVRASIAAVHLEAYVAGQFLIRDGDLPETRTIEVVSSPATAADLADVEAAIRETTAELGREDANPPALLARLTALKARRTALRELPVETELRKVKTGRTRREAWEATDDPATRREVLLDAGLDHVAVVRRERRGQPIDSSRVTIFDHSETDELAAAMS